MSLVIRALAETDSLAELTALLHAAYAQLGQLGFNYTAVDQGEDETRRRIAGGECYVACEDGRLIGTIMFYRNSKGHHPWYSRPDVATVGQFAVAPAFQKRGIGARLMALAEDRAVATGAAEIALDTSEGATHLIAWYTRLGYRRVAHAQWTGKTYRSVILSKALATSRPGK